MTEKELVDLGFVKSEVEVEEDGSVDYYFTLDIGDICFITNCLSDGGSWYVEIFDFDTYRSHDAEDVAEFIHLLTIGTIIK